MIVRKGMLPVMLIAASLSASAASNDETIWSYSKDKDYKVPHSFEIDVLGKEESAYTDILRIVDEINRQKGNDKRYILNNGRMPELTDDVDMVPVYMDKVKNYQGEGNYQSVAPTKFYTKEHMQEIVNSKDPKKMKDFSYAYMEQNLRYYFGNGNKLQDIIVEGKDKFANTVKDEKVKNNEEYLIDGVYKSMDTSGVFNTLGITSQEFKENFFSGSGQSLSAHDAKVLNFLKTKLKDVKGIDAIVKNGELWTTDSEGREHRVIWNAKESSRPEFPSISMYDFLRESLAAQGMETDIKEDKLVIKHGENNEKVALWRITPNDASLEKDVELEKFLKNVASSENPNVTKLNANTLRVEHDGKSVDVHIEEADGEVRDVSWYKNTLLTQFNVFKELVDRGQILYTKDGSMIIENVSDASDLNPRVAAGWGQTKPFDDSVSGKVYEQILTDYVALKDNKMTEKEFKEKWDFEDNSYEVKLNPIKAKQDQLHETTAKVEEAAEAMGGSSWGSLYYNLFDSWRADSNFAAAYAGTSEEAKKYMADNNLTLPEFQALLNDIKTSKVAKEKLESEIPEMIAAAGIERISNADVIIDNYGKIVEFRGRGRVDGTIDFGEGDNRLEIAEQGTGRYGTNITFGPYAKLKNISYIAIGGQYTASTGGVGLSGKSSLAIEIDSTKINDEGRLYQHALKDTWTEGNKIVLKANEINDDNRDDFAIELKISSLGKDIEVDMGRPLEYDAKAFKGNGQYGEDQISAGDIITYYTNFYSDSIAHQLILKDKGNEKEDKNGILKVHVKDSLLRLNNEENAVFKSLVKSGSIGTLSDTLTTSNKKTQFSSTVEEDQFEKQKIMNLMEAIVEQKSPEEVLTLSSHFQISEDKQASLIENIKNIENDVDVKKAVAQLKTLERFKKVDIKPTVAKVDAITSDYNKIIKPNGIDYSSQDAVEQRINAKFGNDPAKITAEIERLKTLAATEFETIVQEFEAIKPANEDEEVVIGGAGYNASKITESVRQKLEEIKDPYLPSYNSPAIQLAKYIIAYRDVAKELETLQATTKDDIYKHIVKELESDATREEYAGPDWINVISNIFYTQRQNESLKELKTLLDQVYEKNIYAKLNKITKDEMDSFTTAIQDTDFDFSSGKAQASGGAASARFSQEDFKGTIYTGYGIYETPVQENLALGLVLGGGTSDFHEIVNDDNKTVTTNSKISGTRAYLGSFARYQVKENLTWMNGLGLQYSSYDVDRDMKNNYQSETYKGEVNTYGGNLYSNLVYTYKVNDTLDAKIKGGLSYTLVSQGDVKEENKAASIEVDGQNFNYLDGQLGFGLTKTIYGHEMKSSLGGTIYAVYGIAGYDNDALEGRFQGSSSDFAIQGQSYQKQSVKLKLDYDVNYDAGLNYGLSGSYLKNSDENNISVGVHAGYTF